MQRTTGQTLERTTSPEMIPREGLAGLLPALSAREADVMRWRYGLVTGQPMKQEDVATALGITQSYVAATERRALERLVGERPVGISAAARAEADAALASAVMRLRGYDGGPVRDQRDVAVALGICATKVGKLERAERNRRGIDRPLRANVRRPGTRLGPRPLGEIAPAVLAGLALTPRERLVIERRTGDAPHTLAEVGRELGLTRQRVAQIEQQVRRRAAAAEGISKNRSKRRRTEAAG